MGNGLTKWALLFVAIASVAWAGVTYVPSGPVCGKWSAGDSVYVESGAYVPEGLELEVEPGVRIVFEGLGRFEVLGRISMVGTSEAPIEVHCPANWRGFRLLNATQWHRLEYVNIMSDMGFARQAIEVIGAGLTLAHCNVEARLTCLRATGGRLEARSNSFFANGLYARAVDLNALAGFASPDCEEAPGNIFQDNFLKVAVPGISPDDVIDPFAMTAGLRVDYSTNICLTRNEIIVSAPLLVVGAWFVNSPTSGDQIWELDHTIIFSESISRAAMGVLNEVDGDLEVTRSTVTVAGIGGFISTCFYASRTAYILVNSSTTVMGGPQDYFFNTSGVGQIDADYLVKWSLDGSTLDAGVIGGASSEYQQWEAENDHFINEGDSIWTLNPLFHEGSDWGNWGNRDEVRSFFRLTSESPCIDRGDPLGGYDPDNTRWDIGADYYDQSSSPVDPTPGIVRDSRMLAAYPNPFNPETVMPIEVAGRGLLRVVVWDVLGREVLMRTVAVYQPGLQNVHFDGHNLASGMYLAQAEFDGQILGSQRLLLLK